MKKLLLLLAVVFLTVIAAASIIFSHFAGKQSKKGELPSSPTATPQRIISLGPALTEDLYLLGSEDRLVGCTIFCRRPEAAQRKAKVGTVVQVNVEKIVSLKPDIVLATNLTDRRNLATLKRLGIKVVVFPEVHNFTEICGQFLQIGELLGVKERAQEIIVQAQKEIAEIEKKIAGRPPKRVFIQVGAKPLFAAGQDTLLNDIIVRAGGVNVVQSTNGLYSREEVIRLNPDVLIITTMGINAQEEEKTWRQFPAINAVKKNQIYIVDSDLLCSPTPVGFVAAVKKTASLLQSSYTNSHSKLEF